MPEPGAPLEALGARRRRALSVIAVGVAIFFLGLAGQNAAWRRGIGPLAAGLILVGLGMLLLTLRHERRGWPHPLVGLVALCAGALNGYEQLYVMPGRLSIGWLLWGLTPYALALAASAFPATRIAAIAGAGAALLWDLMLHREVAGAPPDIAAAFVVMLRPLVSTLVIVPGVLYVSWRAFRRLPDRPLGSGSAARS